MSYCRFCLCSAGLLALAALAGCGPGNPLGREAVSGRVTLDGKPLEFGNISFDPVVPTGGVRSGALITDGEYSIDAHKGLPPGEYKVRIFAGEANPPDMQAPDGGELPAPAAELPGVSLIPPEYNVQSDIVREVTADGDNRFDFEIETQ